MADVDTSIWDEGIEVAAGLLRPKEGLTAVITIGRSPSSDIAAPTTYIDMHVKPAEPLFATCSAYRAY